MIFINEPVLSDDFMPKFEDLGSKLEGALFSSSYSGRFPSAGFSFVSLCVMDMLLGVRMFHFSVAHDTAESFPVSFCVEISLAILILLTLASLCAGEMTQVGTTSDMSIEFDSFFILMQLMFEHCVHSVCIFSPSLPMGKIIKSHTARTPPMMPHLAPDSVKFLVQMSNLSSLMRLTPPQFRGL